MTSWVDNQNMPFIKTSDAPYAALPLGYFRLLRLNLVEAGQISCTFETFPLNEAPAYVALSYAWGSEQPTEHILCNGFNLLVTPHLLEGLRCILSTTTSEQCFLLWIDAICIDQADFHNEKVSQVSSMGTIYAGATQVLVWLGKSEDNSDLAMESIPGLTARLKIINKLDEVTQQNCHTFGLPQTNIEPIWDAVMELFDRPWFLRLWVLQEAVLAKHLIFLCGTKSASLEEMTEFAEKMGESRIIYMTPRQSKLEFPEDRILGGFGTIGAITIFRAMKTTLSLGQLLPMACQKKCAEPVDRVYGLLGLVDARARQALPIDYSTENRTNPWRLFTKLGKFILDTSGFMLFFLLSAKKVPEEVASWLPNILGQVESQALYFEKAGFPPEDCASPYYEESITTHPEKDEIEVHGLLLDKIDSVIELPWTWSSLKYNAAGHKENATKFLAFERQCLELSRRLYSESGQGGEDETVPLAHCRTLVANHDSVAGGVKGYTGDVRQDYLDTMDYFAKLELHGLDEDKSLRSPKASIYRYAFTLNQMWKNRAFFTTERGRIGLGPADIQKGDDACIFFGAHQLFILRVDPIRRRRRMVGDAYIDGLMNGEGFVSKVPEMDSRVFTIV